MMRIFDHSRYHLDFTADSKLLSFGWKPAHAAMNYEDFQEACSNYAGYAWQQQAEVLLVDTRAFAFQIPPDYARWRDEKHYPRLHQLGIKKMAFLMDEAVLPYVDDEPATADKAFVIRYFSEPDAAIAWLTEMVTV